MSSLIDATKPTLGSATTQSVRDNFAAAKTEIEALQSQLQIARGEIGALREQVADLQAVIAGKQPSN